ncbi:MAG: hypothetical protein GTO14_12445, partial [Anaerolineales bacterium]|nr:hypothetical protein [Anaerolineales bacterium]
MTNGLEILSSHNIIRGLSFVAFNSLMTNSGTALKISVGTNNLIEENYFGLETSGVVRGNHKAISIGAIGNTIRANVISGNHTGINVYAISGLSNIMQSNRIGTDPSGTSTSPLLRNQYGIYISTFSSGQIIGGPGPGEGNVISGNYHGIYMYHGGNLIQGNMIGTDISGEQDLGNFVGIVIETTASNNLIGGSSPGMGNIISGNGHGIKIFSDHNTIQGNLIGTNQSGDSSIQNTFGIILQGAAASHNTIGGPGTYETNLISGNEFAGIAILDNAHSNLIQGNLIGSDISGTTPVSNFTGISLYGGFNTIGGTTNAEGNLIAFMDGSSGIRIYEPARGNIIAYNSITENAHGIIATGNTTLENTISHNEIFNNIGIGIDLYPYGITINDFGDADIGPNTVLNYPVLHVDQGVVVGQTCPGCIVEIFLSDDDPVGYGEGKTFLTQVQAQPDGSFTASVSAPGFCDLITATATDQDGNTSEFSKQLAVNCFLIEPPWLYPIFVFIITVFAGIIWAIRRLRPSTPAWLIPIGGVVGAIGLLIIAQALPAVRVDMVPRRGTIPEPPPAECLQYLDADQFAPAREDDFETYDNPSLTWAWA